VRIAFSLLLIAVAPLRAQAPPEPPPQAMNGRALTDEKLDQLAAPVALYPDALLSQVLMAATYPDQVAQAAKWSKQHPDLKGDPAVKQVAAKPWDASVQSLVAFPQVLATLEQKPDWVQELGDAFLAQPAAVMDSVQRLRALAKNSGNLQSNQQQTVETVETPQETAIQIEPANPQMVYVPSYNPSEVYGAWPYPAYPPAYLPAPLGYGIAGGVARGVAFGVGVGVTSALWGGFNWGRHDVNINVNRYNHINANHLSANRNSWTRNNQTRINHARANSHYRQTVNRNVHPNAYHGSSQKRAQPQQRAHSQQRTQGRSSGGGRSGGGGRRR
jgi:uncharacterized membrane protein YgcG